MRNHARALALIATLSVSTAYAQDPKGDVAWDLLAGLTSEVGPRMPGSEAEARARVWAEARLKALGFSKVAVEPFRIRGYVRGRDEANLLAPIPFKLAITALGYSGTTPEKGIEGDVVYFPTLDALKAAPAGSLSGKIAFIDHAMKRNQDGSGYGPYGQVRRAGPAIASGKGAIGVVIRSIGTDSHRNPHTGGTTFPDGVKPIPAGAVSNPDADLIARIARSGKAIRLSLTLTGKTTDNLPSGNVIGDLPGRDPSLPPILLGCHLDSWDLGTGAIDDAAGCAIITAAALKAQEGGAPLRTIRVLWAGSEELGGFGGKAYAEKHSEPHALAMESDFGAARVWRVQFNMADKALSDRIAAALSPMGIVRGSGKADGGTDVEPVIEKQKLSVVDLNQDGTHYFDLHHTPDDTLDKVDPAELAQNVAAWAEVLKVVANEAGPIAAAP
ncbi:M28 family peptidase [Novosphingobium subterraneum]|uniref:Carboxypeptidase Q n=1 Tax=Novosphingobium subterraneum TaxID=48936 RepID=A0A0B9AEX5_9SPHN|nr:M28 family peptidase [Novosphingobium subterraneum]KHS49232.1 peptidase M28 [Novosphingobium subterraneum]